MSRTSSLHKRISATNLVQTNDDGCPSNCPTLISALIMYSLAKGQDDGGRAVSYTQSKKCETNFRTSTLLIGILREIRHVSKFHVACTRNLIHDSGKILGVTETSRHHLVDYGTGKFVDPSLESGCGDERRGTTQFMQIGECHQRLRGLFFLSLKCGN